MCQNIFANFGRSDQSIPPCDKDLLVSIIKDTCKLAFVTAFAWLRPRAFDLLPAASGAPALDQSRSSDSLGKFSYAFSDLFVTRAVFPAIKKVDCSGRM